VVWPLTSTVKVKLGIKAVFFSSAWIVKWAPRP